MAVTDLSGMSHVTLTVTDMARARWFWTSVLGFDVAFESDQVAIFVDRGIRLGVACRVHPDGDRGSFDERRVGLDHLALEVPDVDTLRRWEQRLRDHEVAFTPNVESDWGWHLNVSAPENIAIELLVTRPEVLAGLLGG